MGTQVLDFTAPPPPPPPPGGDPNKKKVPESLVLNFSVKEKDETAKGKNKANKPKGKKVSFWFVLLLKLKRKLHTIRFY